MLYSTLTSSSIHFPRGPKIFPRLLTHTNLTDGMRVASKQYCLLLLQAELLAWVQTENGHPILGLRRHMEHQPGLPTAMVQEVCEEVGIGARPVPTIDLRLATAL